MDSIIAKLLEGNGYTELVRQASGVYAYQSDAYKDVIIVAAYTAKDLYRFDESAVTIDVMQVFDSACRLNPNALKDTSLIICLEVSNTDEATEAQNIILKIEENAFGFRKYVLPFSTQSLSELAVMDVETLNRVVYEKLHAGFDAYEKKSMSAGPIDEYEVVMNLFVKLPFMKIQGSNQSSSQVPLPEFLVQRLDTHSETLEMAVQVSQTYGEQVKAENDVGYDDYDVQVDELLAQSSIQEFLASKKGEGL